ncbi:hypothetical protein N9L68_01715 [bacterium]|nr:hypothetical protein [bacterium]
MLVIALALWRRPLGSDEDAGPPCPLERASAALAGAQTSVERTLKALDEMVSQSINQQLDRSGISVRFEPAVDAALVGQARTLASSLGATVPGDAPVRPDVGELHLVSIAHYPYSQLAVLDPHVMDEAQKDRRVTFLGNFFAAIFYRSSARMRYEDMIRDPGVMTRVDARIIAMLGAHGAAAPPMGGVAAPQAAGAAVPLRVEGPALIPGGAGLIPGAALPAAGPGGSPQPSPGVRTPDTPPEALAAGPLGFGAPAPQGPRWEAPRGPPPLEARAGQRPRRLNWDLDEGDLGELPGEVPHLTGDDAPRRRHGVSAGQILRGLLGIFNFSWTDAVTYGQSVVTSPWWLATWGVAASMLVGLGASGSVLPVTIISWLTFSISLGFTIAHWTSAALLAVASLGGGLAAHGLATGWQAWAALTGAVVVAALGALVVGVEGEPEHARTSRPLRDSAPPYVPQVSPGVGVPQGAPRHVRFEEPPHESAAPPWPPGIVEGPQSHAQGSPQQFDPLLHFVGSEQPQMLQATPRQRPPGQWTPHPGQVGALGPAGWAPPCGAQ